MKEIDALVDVLGECLPCLGHLIERRVEGGFAAKVGVVARLTGDEPITVIRKYIAMHHRLEHRATAVPDWEFRDCPECLAHCKSLDDEFGLRAPLAFHTIGIANGVDGPRALASYLSVHHELGHPDDAQAEIIAKHAFTGEIV